MSKEVVVTRTSLLSHSCRRDLNHNKHSTRQNMMKLCGGVIRAVYASGLSDDAVTAVCTKGIHDLLQHYRSGFFCAIEAFALICSDYC